MFKILDVIFWPFMWVLGGFKLPAQETHPWHVKKYNWSSGKKLIIKETDQNAKFGHSAPIGLYHMPIFGGLTKYVVIEAKGFNNYWNVGWEGFIHKLQIRQNRIMLLVGKKGITVYGLGDNKNNLILKIVGFGELGDGKYNGLRLF